MSAFSSYRANRLWHKGEIAGKRERRWNILLLLILNRNWEGLLKITLETNKMKSIYSKAVFYGCQYISKSYWFSNAFYLTCWQLKWQHLASKIAQNWCHTASACVVASASVFLWFIVCTWVSLLGLFPFSIWQLNQLTPRFLVCCWQFHKIDLSIPENF